MASPAPRWTRLEHDERRSQILSCARRLFAGQNYGAVSLGDIAREAGVTRGLLHHYFGTKRELYLHVVRSMATPPDDLFGAELRGGTREEVLSEAVERFLDSVRSNRETWLATVGAQGFGRDPELEAVLEEARETTAERVIELVRPGGGRASRELRAAIRAYAGFAEAASLEWLQRRRLTREQVHGMLVGTLLSLVDDVLPRVQRA
jgi:AcrR family transcriptional regulator